MNCTKTQVCARNSRDSLTRKTCDETPHVMTSLKLAVTFESVAEPQLFLAYANLSLVFL